MSFVLLHIAVCVLLCSLVVGQLVEGCGRDIQSACVLLSGWLRVRCGGVIAVGCTIVHDWPSGSSVLQARHLLLVAGYFWVSWCVSACGKKGDQIVAEVVTGLLGAVTYNSAGCIVVSVGGHSGNHPVSSGMVYNMGLTVH